MIRVYEELTNTFQIVIIAADYASYLLLLYDNVDWLQSDYQAGFQYSGEGVMGLNSEMPYGCTNMGNDFCGRFFYRLDQPNEYGESYCLITEAPTSAPTTQSPTTRAPTTRAPTTRSPTRAPTTRAPTSSPATDLTPSAVPTASPVITNDVTDSGNAFGFKSAISFALCLLLATLFLN